MKNQRLLKHLLTFIVSYSLVISEPSIMLSQAQTNNEQLRQAQSLIQQGQEQLNQGQALTALNLWQQATQIYRRLQNEQGIKGSLINQSIALQTLGLSPRACKVLLEGLKLNAASEICNTSSKQPTEVTKLLALFDKKTVSPVDLLVLQNLGNALRRLGKLTESEAVLNKTIMLSENQHNFNTSSTLLSLGNTKFYAYKFFKDKYLQVEEPTFRQQTVKLSQQKALEGIEIYQKIINRNNISSSVKLQSLLRKLSLLLDYSQWQTNTKSQNTSVTTEQQIQEEVNFLLKNSHLFEEVSINESIYAQLNFAKSLNQIPDKTLNSLAIKYGLASLRKANSINNKRLMSYSNGLLGELQPEKAHTYFSEALSIAQSIQAWDIAYQWQQQLGKLYQQQGKYQEATQYYKVAIQNFSKIRDNLSTTNLDLQFSFYEKVEPIYRDYIRLLLSSSHPQLDKVIQAYEQLQLAELENYLRCGKLEFIPINSIANLKNKPTIINIIDLGKSIEVIVRSPNQSLHHHSVNTKTIRTSIEYFLNTLQDQGLADTQKSVIIYHSQILYQGLIAPVKKHLPSSGTLVFTLDNSFQSMPMSLLHDGRDYLFKNYSITTALGSRIRPPKALVKEQLKALIAGLSQFSPSFNAQNAPPGLKPLPEVEKEVADVKQQTRASIKLLNEQFTSDNFQQELKTAKFPIVHVTTHGQFSSDPEQTVLLAWDKPINIRELDGWLKVQNNQDPIELLVLSACQTAKGNKRSTLGIAGVAAQAGARTTLASLWLVDAESTAMLIEQFYKGLNNNLSKAEALRQAQLGLLSHPQYQHPYYWAGFVLVGSWL
ncbi:CHAT domain-containing protein [Nostoc parmelioides]|uniref:CHAT domain-containing protein n=1 Tax=Nostoc parmelioides FACHB-3921 TaxID=2692909 RepID=A0ABR8BNL2_9NOSO|nr:CHAT domain-containing protein [Nostoc parmelioides]MBD2255718.1 CHAT domain-containing protein [Nostoc parmelioides FACHB-3921]